MLEQKKTWLAMAALMLLMAATRMHHFGDATHLPDASLAVFILAGVLVSSPLFFVVLLVEAGLLDYLATAQFAVSDWCITPAYGFLIPTYGILWLAGRYYRSVHQYRLNSLIRFSVISVAAISLAFIISNLSFYGFSGHFAQMTLLQYSAEVMPYYGQYMMGGVMYLVLAVLAMVFTHHLSLMSRQRSI